MYYYNARTRESAWSKPENVKILTQAEVEAMATNQQDGPGSNPASSAAGPNNTGAPATDNNAASGAGGKTIV